MKKYFLVLVFCKVSASLFSQTVSADNIKKHISYLADDKLMGRETGSEGERLAGMYISNLFEEYKLAPVGGNNSYFYNFKFKPQSKKIDSVETEFSERKANNIVGYLDNGAQFTVVVGAHYDHLGLGMDHNSLDPNPVGKIHNGADDNASGVAGVLELARYYTSNNVKEKFNFLFICFSGEELGLFGSKKYCENPTIDLAKVNFMINMDMIGRLNDSTKKIIIYGVGTAAEWVPIIDWIKSDFSIKKDSSGIGPSDQTSFYLKDIPVLHFFTGQHSDYHKPSDDVDKINFEGEKKVLEFIVNVISETEKLPKLKFLKTKSSESDTPKYKVTLGVMPDYTFEGKGMRIDVVTYGKSASKAGILKGDVVIKMGELKVENMNDYMAALGKFNKGDTTSVTVLRVGKEVKLNVTF